MRHFPSKPAFLSSFTNAAPPPPASQSPAIKLAAKSISALELKVKYKVRVASQAADILSRKGELSARPD